MLAALQLQTLVLDVRELIKLTGPTSVTRENKGEQGSNSTRPSLPGILLSDQAL